MRLRAVQILFIILIVSGVTAKCQVYDGQEFPTIGGEYMLYTDTTVNYLDSNLVAGTAPWNFATITADYLDTVKFVTVGSTQLAADFPNATLAIIDAFNPVFLSETNGNYVGHGESKTNDNGLLLAVVYDNPVRWLNLPLQLGVAGRDTFQAQLLASGAEVGVLADSVSLRTIRYRFDTVDAVGMITVPGLILDNAIRRIRTDSIIDSVFTKTGGVWSYATNFGDPMQIETSFEWYHQDTDWLVAQAFRKDGWIEYFRYAVGPLPTVRLEFSGIPTYLNIMDTIRDFQVNVYEIVSGNLATGFIDPIRLSSLPDTCYSGWCNNEHIDGTTAVSNAGASSFSNLYFYETGQYQYVARSDTALADTSVVINVYPPTTRLEVSGLPTNLSFLDTVQSFQVSAIDIASGTLASNFADTIRISAFNTNNQGVSWEIQEVAVVANAGIATFNNLRFSQIGEYGLIASSDTVFADTAYISIILPSIRLEFSGLPMEMSILDSAPSFQVSAIDIASGMLVTGFADTITINAFDTSNVGGAPWTIEEIAVAANAGIATFNDLWFAEPGKYKLTASAPSVLSDTSELIHIHPIASYFDLNMDNISAFENEPFPVIQVYATNDSGYVDTLYYQGDVRVGKLSGSGEVLGTYTKPLINGIATFDDLRITRQGQYKLVFYAPMEQTLGGSQWVPLSYVRQDTLTVNINPNSGTWTPYYTDTLRQYVDRANEFFWTGNADGYLSGTSRGTFTEIGQHFDFQGQARLTKVRIHFANRMHVGDDTDTFQIKVYDAGLLESDYWLYPTSFMDSLPISLLGSQYFAADSIHMGDFWIQRPTTIEFDNPPVVNSSFIVSLVTDSELSNDTIIVWTNIPGDAQQEYRTSRLTSLYTDPIQDTVWIRDMYYRPSYDVDLMIEAVLDIDTISQLVGVGKPSPKPQLTVEPNPFTNNLKVNIDGPANQYWLELYALNGERLFSRQIWGNQTVDYDLKELSGGVYSLMVRDRTGKIQGSVKVVKAE